MKAIRLYRIGSDPEFAFTRLAEWDHQLIPANTVISNNKALALASFIGTDAHAATAELRPPPSHNVRSQVMTMASALQSVDEYLKANEKLHDVRMIASPSVANEPLGGHIHLSFFFEDAKYKKLLDHGWNYNNKLVGATWNTPGGQQFNDEEGVVNYVKEKVGKVQLPTPFASTAILNYLLMPFEWWVQLWGSRTKRNTKYGMAWDTMVRWNASPQPKLPAFKDWCYLHYEYRVPSTWLCHPWMCYLYFALVKLTAVNWKLVSETMPRNSVNEVFDLGGTEPRNEDARRIFEERFERLRPNLRWTTDTKDIPKALDYVSKYRNQWVDPYRGIMVDAWKEILG